MKSRAALALLLVFGASAESYRIAAPGHAYKFPRDHFNHPDFQTEWWYYTGNLHTADGRRFGFELTFFRQGVDRGSRPAGVWDVRDVWMAHLALSDLDGGRFFHTERLNRSGPGIAGADEAQARVWNGNWQARWQGSATQQLQAVADQFSFALSLRSEKAPVIHGKNGVSRKAEGPGRASHYISLTRLATSGNITLEGKQFTVEGLSWMDHEFFTNQLESNLSGWDWFSLQFDDGSEMMLFRLRRKDGSFDPYSAGTYVDPQGRTAHLSAGDFSVAPGKTWTHYPIEWTIRVPSLGLEAALTTRLPQQEFTGRTVYWEGAIEISGTRKNGPLKGAGYLEMTGYAGPI
jgi:predicted secreted hydrolase